MTSLLGFQQRDVSEYLTFTLWVLPRPIVVSYGPYSFFKLRSSFLKLRFSRYFYFAEFKSGQFLIKLN